MISFATQFAESTSPSVNVADAAVGNCPCEPTSDVSGSRLSDSVHSAQPCGVCTVPLTDDQREAAIKLAGQAVERHMAVWDREGCFAAYGMAQRALNAMTALIRGRSAAYVAKLDQERGIA